MSLKEKKFFLLDMDGTIYLDNDLFDGTLDFLAKVKAIGGKYLFVTNNSSKSTDAYVEKLSKIGIDSTKEDFLTLVFFKIKAGRIGRGKKIFFRRVYTYLAKLLDISICALGRIIGNE